MTVQMYKWVSGTSKVSNADADEIVLAAPTTAGQRIRLLCAFVSVTVAAGTAGGEVALEDGVNGTRIFEADADAVGGYSITFGELGYPLTSLTGLNLTVDGSGGTQATARCTAVGIVS